MLWYCLITFQFNVFITNHVSSVYYESGTVAIVINISFLPWKSFQPRKGENFREVCDICCNSVSTGSNESTGGGKMKEKTHLILPGRISCKTEDPSPSLIRQDTPPLL